MKEFVTVGYTLSELSPEAARAAYERWLEDGGYDFDSQYTIDDMIECGATIGINVDNIYYSGFSSQGDGACFVGSYQFKPDWKSSLENFCPGYTQLSSLGERLEKAHTEFGELYVTVYKTTYHYDHENTVTVDVDFDLDDEDLVDEEISILDAQDTIEEILKDFMHEIYRRLEEEYTWTNSLEFFQEMAEANEFYFTEEGKML